MRLTDPACTALRSRPKRYIEWDDNSRGLGTLGIRVTPAGRKSWVFMYKYRGRARMLTLGSFPRLSLASAHQAAGAAMTALERQEDPAVAEVSARREARRAPTVADLAREYLERWAKPHKRSWAEDERILNRDILPAWGHERARGITRRDVIALLDTILDRGAPIQANRTLALLSRMFRFAVERDLLAASPCFAVRAPSRESPRDRVLTEDEIRVFWRGLDQARMGQSLRLALRLQLVTAQRRGEIVNALWAEFDWAGGWWTIPKSRAKNGLAHRVPLTSLALELLTELKTLAGESPWVCPSPYGDKPITDRALTRALASAQAIFAIPHFTPHDLRRTAASLMSSLRIPRLVVGKILNHAEAGITAVYDRHTYDAEKRQALEVWAHHLQVILDEGGTMPTVATHHAG